MSEGMRHELGNGPYDGKTRKLELPAEVERRCGGVRFPWQMLWLIWPLMFLFKGASFLAAPLINLITHCTICTATITPLLLIGAGLVLVLIGNLRSRG